MSSKVVRVRGGENCPSYQSKEMQADLIGQLTKKVVNKAVLEEDAPVDELRIETKTSVRSDPEELL